jgi:hypothetical protein
MSGPAFGHSDGSVATLSKYNRILHWYLLQIQQEDSGLILDKDDVRSIYSLFEAFKRQLKGELEHRLGSEV